MDKMMDIERLLCEWHTGLRIRHIAHHMSCQRYSKMHRVFGIPVVIVSVIVGTSIFSTLDSSPDRVIQIVAGILSVSAAVLASLQTFLGYSELSEKHKVTAVKYGALRRQLEEWEACSKFPCDEMQDLIAKLRTEWDMIDIDAPENSRRILRHATEQVRDSQEKKDLRGQEKNNE